MNMLILNRKLYNYAKKFSLFTNYDISLITKMIKLKNLNVINCILLLNKEDIIKPLELKLLNKSHQKTSQNEESTTIKPQYKNIDLISILLNVLYKTRIDIKLNTVMFYFKIINELQYFILNNLINYNNLYKKIVAINNHMQNKLSDQEIKMFAKSVLSQILIQ